MQDIEQQFQWLLKVRQKSEDKWQQGKFCSDKFHCENWEVVWKLLIMLGWVGVKISDFFYFILI